MLNTNQYENRILAKIKLGLKLTDEEKLYYVYCMGGV